MASLQRIFFENVLWLIRANQMTQAELAQKARMSATYLSDIMAGRANPSLRIVEAIAHAFGVSPLDLLDSKLPRTQVDNFLPRELKKDFELVSVVLPSYKAFIVKKWAKEYLNKD